MENYQIEIKHSYELRQTEKEELFIFLDQVFEGNFSREDLSHALGGIHLFIKKQETLIGHVSIVQRSMVVGKKAYYVGYVEAMAVSENFQRRGIGQKLMSQVNEIIENGYDFGALCSSKEGFVLYKKMDWKPWQGKLKEFNLSGIKDSDEKILVFNLKDKMNVNDDFVCDYREGDCW